MAGVIVPLDGVEAKLSMAKKPLAAQSKNAANTRAETVPGCWKIGLFMMPYESEKTAKRFYLRPKKKSDFLGGAFWRHTFGSRARSTSAQALFP